MVDMIHEAEGPDEHKRDYQQPERKLEHIVGIVRSRSNVQEKHKVDAHLCDGENNEPYGNTGSPNLIGHGHVKGSRREQDGERKSNHIALDFTTYVVVTSVIVILAHGTSGMR